MLQIASLLSYWTLVALLPGFLAAQAQDSAAVNEHIEKAKKIAGTECSAEAHFFCDAPRANNLIDPLLEPANIKKVILTHGHVDHFGGTPYIKSTTIRTFISRQRIGI